jgi:hypothetical protein
VRAVLLLREKYSVAFPAVAAVVADGSFCVSRLDFILFGLEDFNYESRQGKKQPLYGHPPESNKNPPENAVFLLLNFCFRNNLNGNVIGTAFGTCHILLLL